MNFLIDAQLLPALARAIAAEGLEAVLPILPTMVEMLNSGEKVIEVR